MERADRNMLVREFQTRLKALTRHLWTERSFPFKVILVVGIITSCLGTSGLALFGFAIAVPLVVVFCGFAALVAVIGDEVYRASARLRGKRVKR